MRTPPHIKKAAKDWYDKTCQWCEEGMEPHEAIIKGFITILSAGLEPSEEEVLAAAIEMWREAQTQADEIGMPYPPASPFDEMHSEDKPRFLRIARAGLVAAAKVRGGK